MHDVIPWWIVENTLIAGLLSLVVMLVCRARRVPPVIRHGLWLVVFVRLVMPPVFSIAIPVPSELVKLAAGLKSKTAQTLEPAGTADTLPGPDSNLAESTTVPLESDNLGRPPELSDTALMETVDQPIGAAQPFPDDQVAERTLQRGAARAFAHADCAEIDSTRASAFTSRMLLGPGFVLATIGVVLFQVVRLFRLRGLLKRSVAGPPDLDRLVAELAAEMRVTPPRVRLSAEIQSPVVCALGRATLVWPASGPAVLLGAEGRRAIVVHELAHLARRDHWIGWVELSAGCLWWWNPLYWYVRHQLHENAELACDAWVAGICPDERRAYARALVDLAEFDSLNTAAAPAFGVGDGSRKLFERRLVMILGNRVRYQMGGLGTLGMLLLALVVMPGCGLSQASEDVQAQLTEGIIDSGSLVLADESTLPFLTLTERDLVQSGAPVTPATEPATTPVVEPVTRSRIAVPVLSDSITVAPGTPTTGPGTGTPDVGPAPSSEDRLKRLEDRFDALLNELRESRGAGRMAMPSQPVAREPSNKPQPGQPGTPMAMQRSADAADMSMKLSQDIQQRSGMMGPPAGKKAKPGTDGRIDIEAVSLTRITYKLPPGKAEALAAFFSANLSDDIEVRVKDNALQITASEKDQGAIGQFMRLVANQRPAEQKKPFAPGEKPEWGTRPSSDRISVPVDSYNLHPTTPDNREVPVKGAAPERQ
jgi:beta-lactamase regulating signal transducer with metallopeptidase domain